MQKRNIVVSILLTVLTCGLYWLYWLAKLTNEIHALSGKKTTAGGGKAALYFVLTCSLYFYYWLYKTGEELIEARRDGQLKLDPVSNLTYAVVTIAATALLAAYSVLNAFGENIDLLTSQGNEAALIGVLFACAIGVALHIVIAGLLLFLIYRRADENPRLLYILMGLFRTNIFTFAFLQYSVNEMIEHHQSGKMEAV